MLGVRKGLGWDDEIVPRVRVRVRVRVRRMWNAGLGLAIVGVVGVVGEVDSRGSRGSR